MHEVSQNADAVIVVDHAEVVLDLDKVEDVLPKPKVEVTVGLDVGGVAEVNVLRKTEEVVLLVQMGQSHFVKDHLPELERQLENIKQPDQLVLVERHVVAKEVLLEFMEVLDKDIMLVDEEFVIGVVVLEDLEVDSLDLEGGHVYKWD